MAILLYKTETCFALGTESLVFGEPFSLAAVLGILCGVVGVVLTANAKYDGNLLRSLTQDRGQLIGLLAAFCIANAAVCTRQGILNMAGGEKIANATFYLLALTLLETVLLGGCIFVRDRGQFSKLNHNRVASLTVGLTSALGSFCWLWAFSLTSVAFVKTVGQLEVILSGFSSRRFFAESIRPKVLACKKIGHHSQKVRPPFAKRSATPDWVLM